MYVYAKYTKDYRRKTVIFKNIRTFISRIFTVSNLSLQRSLQISSFITRCTWDSDGGNVVEAALFPGFFYVSIGTFSFSCNSMSLSIKLIGRKNRTIKTRKKSTEVNKSHIGLLKTLAPLWDRSVESNKKLFSICSNCLIKAIVSHQ